jgi:hypothetical protein
MLTKTCTACGVEKSVDEYHKMKALKYGVKAECKCCSAKRGKEYYLANKEAIDERNKAYFEDNREAVAKYRKAWRAANKEAVAEQRKAWLATNKEAVAEQKKAYQKANPHIFNAHSAKRRATKLQATPAWADHETIKGMYQLAVLFNSTGINLHVDHIVPLISDKVCGLHCEANLQLLSATENKSKGNRQWPDM